MPLVGGDSGSIALIVEGMEAAQKRDSADRGSECFHRISPMPSSAKRRMFP
jgi:hypothetical protein